MLEITGNNYIQHKIKKNKNYQKSIWSIDLSVI